MATTQDLGIDIKVKGATVKKDLFGMETWGKVVARIKGEISANFLPVTSDRSNFVTDSRGISGISQESWKRSSGS